MTTYILLIVQSVVLLVFEGTLLYVIEGVIFGVICLLYFKDLISVFNKMVRKLILPDKKDAKKE